MDHVVNVRFKSDGNRHVCEIQFVHKTLLIVREGMGGHHVYNYSRSALELLETKTHWVKVLLLVEYPPIFLSLSGNFEYS
jgi:hypothetical protein